MIGVLTTIMTKSLKATLLHKGVPMIYKEDLVSPSSISFHRMNHHEMRRYKMLLYRTATEQCGRQYLRGEDSFSA
jgi:hypothetical protein